MNLKKYLLSQLLILTGNVQARPILIQYHLSGMPGIGLGLVQPKSLDKSSDKFVWPVGIHNPLSQGESEIHFLNQGTQKGPLFFNKYGIYLEKLSNEICIASGVRQSGSPNQQRIESLTLSPTIDRHVPLIHAFNEQISKIDQKPTLSLSVPRSLDEFYSGEHLEHTLDVWTNSSLDIKPYIISLNAKIKKHKKDQEVADQIYTKKLDAHYKSWIKKNPRYKDWYTHKNKTQSIQSQTMISEYNAEKTYRSKLISSMKFDRNHWQQTDWFEEFDSSRMKGYHKSQLHNIVGLLSLIKTNRLGSALIEFNYKHSPHRADASDAIAGKESASIWKHIHDFWQEIKNQGLDNQVLLLVTSDNSGSYYGHHTRRRYQYADNKTVYPSNRSTGKAFAMLAIHSDLAGPCRVGNFIDGFTPAPSSNIMGDVDLDKPAFTQLDIVAALLLELYPNYFDSPESIQQYWPSYNPNKKVPKMRGGT